MGIGPSVQNSGPSGNAALQKENISYFANLFALGPFDPSNQVYALVIIFFLIMYLTPVLYWLYRVVLVRLVKEATKQMIEIQKRVSERLSDAGRKLSERMRA